MANGAGEVYQRESEAAPVHHAVEGCQLGEIYCQITETFQLISSHSSSVLLYVSITIYFLNYSILKKRL